MRLLLRIAGTLLIATAVILLIIDGTKSLAANGIVITALGETWQQVSPQSLDGLKQFFETRLFGALLEAIISAILGFPGWAVIGVPGILLAWAGRSRRERVFLRQDQI
jgi:ABC-type phosphate transport system permease subunit